MHYKRWRRHGDPRIIGGGHAATPTATVSPRLRDLAWAAGFLEADGHFAGDGHVHRVTGIQTSPEPLLWLQAMFGGSVRYYPTAQAKRGDRWHWLATGARARGVMLTLYPLLSGRRKAQVRVAFDQAEQTRAKV